MKKLKAEGGDKDGLREAEVRKEFNGILNNFGLGGKGLEDDQPSQPNQPRNYFRDKRLNRLWEKAEKSGLSEEELIALKQEFRHHQEKVTNQLISIFSLAFYLLITD